MIPLFIKRRLYRLLDRFYPAPDEWVNVGVHYRDRWIAEKAAGLKPGSKVLDTGAGQCPYRPLFSHCEYQTQDFSHYEGTPSGPVAERWRYGAIDYVCDITKIPAPDGSFDAIVCTEVLEHVPHPVDALRELARLLAPDGRLFLTAPLGSGLHQEPYHFYGGYTPHFYRKFLGELGLEIVELKATGGLMKHVGQEAHRAGRMLEERTPDRLSLPARFILKHWLPRYLGRRDDGVMVEEFTVGYLVEARKRA